ncbi:unnamed protein product [Bursaphelenchus xylophilus]|uniref:(pine wood nematode) hypothetical protein n=1 Tax=Bursaphelenchus xylophilus TaxID=6326 RepID=A0A7I8XGF0_BURXY|nr:unnamed protein product [Bursaphelenchus xylophilus]CAG9081561.1 unnamed protein product [Bursaphelenchus xylophilus]
MSVQHTDDLRPVPAQEVRAQVLHLDIKRMTELCLRKIWLLEPAHVARNLDIAQLPSKSTPGSGNVLVFPPTRLSDPHASINNVSLLCEPRCRSIRPRVAPCQN